MRPVETRAYPISIEHSLLCIDLCNLSGGPLFQGKRPAHDHQTSSQWSGGGNGSNRKGAKGVSTLLGWWVVRLRGAMHLDTEKAVTALMTVAIAGVGPACIGLMLLL